MPTADDFIQSGSTYIIDAESAAEMARLMNQDRLMTKGMGGLFPEEPDLSTTGKILDVACGPGGWVLDVAFEYPRIEVTGIDISQIMIGYARAQARARGLKNVTFQVMDALQPLAFPDNTFDFVNARLLVGFVPRALWPGLVREYTRITRPGGIVRLTESDEFGTTNCAALEGSKVKSFQAMKRAGLSVSPNGVSFGITPLLGRYLREAGCEYIEHMAHVIEFSAGTPAHQPMYENLLVGLELTQPFLIKLGAITPEEGAAILKQAYAEMMADDFCGLFSYITVWGTKPVSS